MTSFITFHLINGPAESSLLIHAGTGIELEDSPAYTYSPAFALTLHWI